jgi:hypothetical protein
LICVIGLVSRFDTSRHVAWARFGRLIAANDVYSSTTAVAAVAAVAAITAADAAFNKRYTLVLSGRYCHRKCVVGSQQLGVASRPVNGTI